MSPRDRTLLFAAVTAALITAALLLGHGADTATSPASPPRTDLPLAPRRPGPKASPGAPAASARRFLTAFLRYEVGDRDPSVARDLRRTSTHQFASDLLRDPPLRRGQAEGRPATLGRLSIVPIPGDPPLVSVSATARRRSGPEQLSFVFELRGGRWLASAPGE